jgi:membrane-bound ClpP family serine protease
VSESLLLWGLGLLATALLLVVVEVFVPSGGLISLLSLGCAIAGIVCLFQISTAWGIAGILSVLVLAPLALGFALKIWPSTPIGRRLILGDRSEEEIAQEKLREMRERDLVKALVGTEGLALTDLRPVGTVQVGGKRYEALAEGKIVPAGTRVRITAAQDNQIRVRPIA